MLTEQNFNKNTELSKTKQMILSRELDSNSLSSIEIKGLLEVLDWSSETEKRVIIDLCRIISVRGDAGLITGE